MLGDLGGTVVMANASANVVTIPTHASVAFNNGDIINIIQGATGATSVTGATGVTINSNGSLTASGVWIMLAVQQLAVNSWVLVGHTA